MLLHLRFQTAGNFSCVTLQIKEVKLLLEHDINLVLEHDISHWYECL